MVLVFIDESGSPSLKDKEEIFLLTAILIKEEDYQSIDLQIENFREELCYKYEIPLDFEIHIKTLLGNLDKKDKLSAFKGIEFEKRQEIFEKIYILCHTLKFKIISVAILKKELKKEINVRFWANLILLERIQMFMEDFPGHAIIFMDNENSVWNAEKIRILKNALFYPETHPSFVKIRNVISTIYFLDSNVSMGIQIADSISYCIRRWLRYIIYKKEGVIDKLNLKNFELIKEKIHKYPKCIQKGLKLFPSKFMELVKENIS